jgi:hypothetical protein
MSPLRAAATVLLIVACLASVPAASAQPAVATLAGRVVDAQSAPTPGASVTVRSLSTATMWYATSDQEGRFAFPMLPPGPYGVDVSLSGFAQWRAESVTLQVGQDQQLDVRLALGGLQEGVVVIGEARPITTVVDGVLSAGQIESMPLNGRNFLELALLVPGNAPTPVFDPTKTNSVLIASAGQMGRGGNITIDGQDNNDDVVGGPLLNLPIDAVQEFQIATNRFGANLGRSASSVINVVTRSGTNVNLGSVAVFARDDSWQALPATLDTENEALPFDRQQMSGASVISTALCSSVHETPPRGRSTRASRPRRFAMVSGRCDSTPEALPAASWRATPASGPPMSPRARSNAPSDR